MTKSVESPTVEPCIDLSIIVPVYNEEQNLPLLFDAIHASMKTIIQTDHLGNNLC